MTGEQLPIFYVAGVVEGQYAWVLGRGGDKPIRKGDIFTTAILYRLRESVEDFERPPEIVDRQSVDFRVIEVQAYGKALEELGPGMTGSLALTGQGINRIREGYVLQSAHTPQDW